MLMLNNLIGFGAGGGIVAVVQQDSATSTASTITWPSVKAGDIAVLHDYAASAASTPTAVTPDGFTNACDSSNATLRAMTSWKLCTGAESGSLTGMNGNVSNRKAMVTAASRSTIRGSKRCLRVAIRAPSS
jgi:hypothetical protein